MDVSDGGGSNVTVDTFEAGQFAANYNSAMAPPEGWSTVTATTTALQAMNHKCDGVAIGFSGRPDLGRVITLDLSVEDDTAGTNLADRGKLFWQHGCMTDGPIDQWRSTSGSLEITSVDEVAAVYAGTDRDSVKTVGFTFTDVAMAPDPTSSGAASGTFTADGDGSIDLFVGLTPTE